MFRWVCCTRVRARVKNWRKKKTPGACGGGASQDDRRVEPRGQPADHPGLEDADGGAAIAGKDRPGAGGSPDEPTPRASAASHQVREIYV